MNPERAAVVRRRKRENRREREKGKREAFICDIKGDTSLQVR